METKMGSQRNKNNVGIFRQEEHSIKTVMDQKKSQITTSRDRFTKFLRKTEQMEIIIKTGKVLEEFLKRNRTGNNEMQAFKN